mgnify:CR=1 FL=1
MRRANTSNVSVKLETITMRSRFSMEVAFLDMFSIPFIMLAASIILPANAGEYMPSMSLPKSPARPPPLER